MFKKVNVGKSFTMWMYLFNQVLLFDSLSTPNISRTMAFKKKKRILTRQQ